MDGTSGAEPAASRPAEPKAGCFGSLKGVADCDGLLERAEPMLIRAARRQFGLGDEDARDLAMEVIGSWLAYAKTRKDSMEYRSPEHLFATLHRMLTQRYIDRRRKRSSLDEALWDGLQADGCVDDLVLLLQRKELIREAFCKLPERRQTALRACYVDGLTQDEAAERYGIDRRLISDWKRSLECSLTARAKEIGLDD